MVSLGVDNEGDGNWLQKAANKLANIGGGRGQQNPNPSFSQKMAQSQTGGIANASSGGSIINSPFNRTSSKGSNIAKRQMLPPTKLNIAERLAQQNQGGGMQQEESDLEKLISELLNQTNQGHTWESRAQDEAEINNIFGSQLSAIANARTDTSSRFDTSLANTKSLYSGHEHDIRNADKASYQGIAKDQAASTNQVYDSGVQQMQASQTANRDQGAEMLQRLGLQASAPVVNETANESQKAIDGLVQAKVAQQDQNTAYAGADMRRNDERAQSIADEGVSQQADLSRQLQDILGELSNKEADVNSQKSEAMMGARQRSEDNWRGDRDYATSALASLMESQGKASSEESQSMNAPQMTNILNGLGINDPGLQKNYSSAYTDAVLNANYVPGVQDQTTAYLKYLTENNDRGLDANVLQQLISGNLNYGSYKVGAPTS